MTLENEIAGYLLTASVALAGASGARLKNTGELSRLSKVKPLYTFIATILYGLSGIAAVLYFSWAFLNWKQMVAFLLVGVFLTGGVARSDSRIAIWTVFNLSVFAAIASEVFLLFSPSFT